MSNKITKNELHEDIVEQLVDSTSHIHYGVLEGLSANKTINIPSITSYKEGLAFSFKNDGSGSPTTPVTINLNGLGAKPLLKSNLSPFTLNLLKNNSIYTVRYNGASFVLQGEGAYGNAIASDLLSGKTAGSDVGDIVGTMPNIGSQIITPSTVNKAIIKGYHDGTGYMQGSPNLIASNIKQGVNIFGVVGDVTPRTSNSGSRSVSEYGYFTINTSINYSIIYIYNASSPNGYHCTFYRSNGTYSGNNISVGEYTSTNATFYLSLTSGVGTFYWVAFE